MLTLLACTLLSVAPAKPPSLYSLDADTFASTAQNDLLTLKRFIEGMDAVAATVKANRSLFSAVADRVYDPEQKRLLLSTWGSLFAYFSATEGLRQKYWDFVGLAPTDPRHAWGFLLTHTALTALLSHGLAFAEATINNKQLETIFDEPSDEFGLPRGAFADFKLKAIHVSTTSQLMTGDMWLSTIGVRLKPKPGPIADTVTWAIAEMKRDAAAAKTALGHSGIKLFGGNVTDLIKDHSAHAIFPVQKSFAEWAGRHSSRFVRTRHSVWLTVRGRRRTTASSWTRRRIWTRA